MCLSVFVFVYFHSFGFAGMRLCIACLCVGVDNFIELETFLFIPIGGLEYQPLYPLRVQNYMSVSGENLRVKN